MSKQEKHIIWISALVLVAGYVFIKSGKKPTNYKNMVDIPNGTCYNENVVDHLPADPKQLWGPENEKYTPSVDFPNPPMDSTFFKPQESSFN